MEENQTTSGPDLVIPLERGAGRLPGAQLEDRLRTAIRVGMLHPGSRLPSTRTLARDVGCSRGVVVEAYYQLVAEGYLEARPGSGTRVSPAAQVGRPAAEPAPTPAPFRHDFRPGLPDLCLFPRDTWLAALRSSLRAAPDAALGYGDPRGTAELRTALAAYLGRVRGVAADSDGVIVCSGFAQGLRLLCQVLRVPGIERIAVEEPNHPDQRRLVAQAGLQPVPVPVDDDGLRVDLLAQSGAQAVLVTPAHQFPSGVVLTPARRAALLAWARARNALVVEDDYDAEYRYDRAPIGAMQGLDPARVVYAGSASKMLAPALRLGWLVPPASLVDALADAKRFDDLGSPALDQLAFAHVIETGALDRHLRRARMQYRARRDALVQALARHIPAARVRGIAAGLHAVVDLPPEVDEGVLVEAAARRGVGVYGLSDYRSSDAAPAALVLGYAALSEPDIRAGVAALGAAVTESSDLCGRRVSVRV